MAATVLLFDPTAPLGGARFAGQNRLDGLAGKVIGFIDNAKPNFNHLVDDLADIFVAQYGVTRVLKRQKRSPAVAAPDAYYRELAAECDLVITGSGD
jgi:hypothetical protein